MANGPRQLLFPTINQLQVALWTWLRKLKISCSQLTNGWLAMGTEDAILQNFVAYHRLAADYDKRGSSRDYRPARAILMNYNLASFEEYASKLQTSSLLASHYFPFGVAPGFMDSSDQCSLGG